MRSLAPCNAFLAGLPLLMDKNLSIGKLILPTVLALLRYLPAPHEPDIQPLPLASASFTIGLLDFQARHYWLQTLLVILYKHEFTANSIRFLIQVRMCFILYIAISWAIC